VEARQLVQTREEAQIQAVQIQVAPGRQVHHNLLPMVAVSQVTRMEVAVAGW